MNLSLAGLFLRSRAARRAALPLLLVALAAWSVLHVLVAVRMNPDQRVWESMGSADGTSQVPLQVLAGSDVPDLFRPDAVDEVVTALSASPSWIGVPERVTFMELTLPSIASEGRLELIDGRLPQSPGEVLLTPTAGEMFRQGPPRPVLGQLSLTVVGTVRQVFSTSAATIVAAPGTWNTWNIADQEAELAGETAQVTLHWRASDADAAAAAYTARYDEADGSGFPSTQTRAGLHAALSEMGIGQVSRILLAYGVPVAAVLMVGGWLAGALGARIGTRILVPLRDVGVSAAMLSSTLVTTLLAVSAGLVGAAAIVSYALLAAARPFMALFLDHPIRPWEWSAAALLVTALLGLIASVVGSWAGMRRARRAGARRRFAVNRRAEKWLRWAAAPVLAVGLLAATSGSATYSAQAQVIICVSVAIGLLTPTVLRAVSGIRVVPSPALAALRFTGTRLSSLGAYTGLVVLLVSVAVSTLAVAGSIIANLNVTNSRLAPPGTAFTSGDLGQPPPAVLVTRFEHDVGVGNPVSVWESHEMRTNDDSIATWAFATEQDMVTVLGSVDAPLRAALATGPVPTAGEPRTGTDTPFMIVPREFEWVGYVDLQSRQRLDAHTTIRQLYTGLTSEQDAAASGWDRANGIGGSFVKAHTEPEPWPIPTSVQLSAGGFGIVVALIAYFLLRAETATYRPLLAGLNAVGLGRRWLLRMLGVVGGVVGLTCAVAGLIAVLVNLTLVSYLLPETVFIAGAPWIAIAAMLGTSVIGAVVGAAFAARSLHARERKI